MAGALALLLFLAGCGGRGKAVSGTIEVDEAHVGPRAGGRVEKILHWEGDHLREGELIAQLDASELTARRSLAVAQIDTAVHDADAQQAQLVFLNDEARRQKDLLTRKVVSSSDAERADSWAKTQRKTWRRQKCVSRKRTHNLPISTPSWRKCKSLRQPIPFWKCLV